MLGSCNRVLKKKVCFNTFIFHQSGNGDSNECIKGFYVSKEREEGCSTTAVPETYCEEKIEARVLGGFQPMDGGPYGVSFLVQKKITLNFSLPLSYFS